LTPANANIFRFYATSYRITSDCTTVTLAETGEEEDQEPQEQTDRKYWVSRANPKSIELLDSLVAIVRSISEPRLTYNKGHIAVGTLGRNSLWCHPRKGSHIHFEIKVGEERDNLIAKFEEQGLGCNKSFRPEIMKITLTAKELEENKASIEEVIAIGEGLSH